MSSTCPKCGTKDCAEYKFGLTEHPEEEEYIFWYRCPTCGHEWKKAVSKKKKV